MSIETFRFWVALPEHFYMPKFAGSMLRGGFGHALRYLVCMTQQQRCCECALRKSCPYTHVFEVQAQQNQVNQVLPSPYIIQPGSVLKQNQRKNYFFDFTLIGAQALRQLPVILFAWRQAFKRGFGRERTPFVLIKVVHVDSNKTVFTEKEPVLEAYSPSENFLDDKPSGEVEIKFLSPLRLQQKKKLVGRNEFNLSILFNAMVRRNRAVSKQLLGVDSDFVDLGNLNHSSLTLLSLGWQDWSRYSKRQQQKMDLGGLIGRVQFHASVLTNVQWQHLLMAQKINVGKHTVFGMGKIEVNTFD